MEKLASAKKAPGPQLVSNLDGCDSNTIRKISHNFRHPCMLTVSQRLILHTLHTIHPPNIQPVSTSSSVPLCCRTHYRDIASAVLPYPFSPCKMGLHVCLRSYVHGLCVGNVGNDYHNLLMLDGRQIFGKDNS